MLLFITIPLWKMMITPKDSGVSNSQIPSTSPGCHIRHDEAKEWERVANRVRETTTPHRTYKNK